RRPMTDPCSLIFSPPRLLQQRAPKGQTSAQSAALGCASTASPAPARAPGMAWRGSMARRERAGTPASRPVAGDFQLTPGVEASLNALARAGREDPAARNELYAALGLKVARFLAPYRGWELSGMEFADVEQEAFLVFVGLVADWGGTGSFGRYFLGFFPWRLRHAVDAGERQWPRGR